MLQLLDALLSLQKVDDQLSGIVRRKREIPERIQALEKGLADEKRQLEEDRGRLKQTRLHQRELEKRLQESAEDRKKKQRRLLEVKTNEEYRALLKEIEFAEQADSRIEDEILLLFEQIDSLETTIREKEFAVQEHEKRVQRDRELLEEEALEIEKEHRCLERERERICSELDPDVLRDYEKIRARRSGQAVVTITHEVCPGCHMHVPPQTINEVLQTGEIRHCPNCRRILYCELEETA